MNYRISISGSGTREEIIDGLKHVLSNLELTSDEKLKDRATDTITWEDPTLLTFIVTE